MRRPPHVDLATADGHDRYVPSEDGGLLGVGHEGVYEWATARLLPPGGRLLDLGCGTGYGSVLVTGAGGDYDGIDTSPAAVEYATSHYACTNVRFFVADVLAGVPPAVVPGGYDVVFSSEVLEHVVDPFAFVAIMARYVRQDGACFVGTPNRLWSLEHMAEGGLMARSHVMEFTPPALEALLRTAFDDVTVMLRMFPPGAVESTLLPQGRPRMVRAAAAFAREAVPAGVRRRGRGLWRRRDRRAWTPGDIEWLDVGDGRVDMSRCVGLAAVCRGPRR